MEVLESAFTKDNDIKPGRTDSDDSVYTDSEKESNDSDDIGKKKGIELLQKIETKLIKAQNSERYTKQQNVKINHTAVELSGRRRSGPDKYLSLQAEKSNISKINTFKAIDSTLTEENEVKENFYRNDIEKSTEDEIRPRKSILKNPRRPSEPIREGKNRTQYVGIHKSALDHTVAEDTETSGYRSTGSSRQNESESESDYGYSTIAESTTPKKLELRVSPCYNVSSGVLPDECWTSMQVRAVENWSDEDEELDDTASKLSLSRNLYETIHYLSSTSFMNNFVDDFIINLGSGLGLTQDAISTALKQGASIYCDTTKHGTKMSCEVFPALIAAWPNAANQWIIRERRIIQNPRTNFSYQWPTKYMVNKAIGFGCLLVPVGFRPKRGLNPEQMLQWRIIFPAAERYLESCLAHSHMRCYLFALALHKTFMENETSKIGIDASHIKNHLFWQCEENYAKWPEDRLGETLRLFLRTFYMHFGQARFPNYFIETCNDFKSIPKPLLLKLQRRLADILEAPVMHVLNALDKVKYKKRDFYPTFNSYKLYEILTCKNPLRILNPQIPITIANKKDSSDSEEETQATNIWDSAKAYDKHYQWKRERQRQIQERRKAQFYNKKQKTTIKQEREIHPKVS